MWQKILETIKVAIHLRQISSSVSTAKAQSGVSCFSYFVCHDAGIGVLPAAQSHRLNG